MTINSLSNHHNNVSSSEKSSVDEFKDQFNNTIFAKYNDTDGIVDESDVIYKAETKESNELKNFLNKFKGQNWTKALKEEFNNLINRFNLEKEGDELFDEVDDLLFDNNNKTKARTPQKAITSGDYTPEYDKAIHSLEKESSWINNDKNPYSNNYLDSTFEKYKNELNELRKSTNLADDVTADLINDLLKDYKKTMNEWQDGTHYDLVRQNDIIYTNVVAITLKNGEHAYKSDQGVFYPYYNGSIGGNKVPEELYE